MVVLRAIGGFFARIGRWIKETAWIQPLLIVGAIFAVIFAIPHIIDGVKGWFNSSDDANKYFAKTQLSLKNANKFDSNNAGSEVDKFLTYIENGDVDKLKAVAHDRGFFTDIGIASIIAEALNITITSANTLIKSGKLSWGQFMVIGAVFEMTPKEFCDIFMSGYFREIADGVYKAHVDDYEALLDMPYKAKVREKTDE